MVFEGVKLHSCSVGGKWLYLVLPKIGRVKVRHHRPIPNGAVLKQTQAIKKSDGWYINLRLQDDSVPEFVPDITPTWDNSLAFQMLSIRIEFIDNS